MTAAMPLWSDDPIVVALTIVAVWGFFAACVIRDRRSGKNKP